MRIIGFDCYSGYGRIDWTRVARAGYRFVFVKCSEGNEPRRNDTRFAENVEGAKAAGLYVGAYHFGYSLPTKTTGDGRSPLEECRRAFDACKGLGRDRGELPPVIDAEWPEVGDWGKWGCSPKQLSEWYREYCKEATRLWGRRPIIYTYPFWWRTISASATVGWAAEYPLWIASGGALNDDVPPDTKQPTMPGPWTRWTFWQYGFKGSSITIPGVLANPVDRDCFNGGLDDLRRLANIDPDEDTAPDMDATVVVHVPFRSSKPPPDDEGPAAA